MALKSLKTIFTKSLIVHDVKASLFTVAKKWKQSESPSADGWINKMEYIQTMEYYSSLKSKEMIMCHNVENLEDIMLSEISHNKDKCCMISLT